VKRRALSSRLTGEKIVFFILLVTVLLFCIKHYPELLLIAAPIFIFLDYLLYYRPNRIEFDDNYLFIKRKKGEEIVALKDVYLVKSTAWGIGFKTIWKMRYYNRNGEGTARFYPRKRSQGFGDFVRQLRLKNPKVEIRV
jgi:hypothetical protein